MWSSNKQTLSNQVIKEHFGDGYTNLCNEMALNPAIKLKNVFTKCEDKMTSGQVNTF